METMLSGATVGLKRPSESQKQRDTAIRLECLRLATEGDQSLTTDRAITIAQELFDFVVDKPKRPGLFAVKRMDAVAPADDIGPREYLTIAGCFVSWGFEGHAFRFRSKAEAEAAIERYVESPINGLVGVALVVPLPSYMDAF